MTTRATTVMAAVVSSAITAIATVTAAYLTARQGVVSFPNPNLQKQVDALRAKLDNKSSVQGDYEWQWAGGNWVGSVSFRPMSNGSIQSKVDMRTFKVDEKTGAPQVAAMFKSDGDGSAVIKPDSVQVHLPVVFFDKPTPYKVNLDGDLTPVDAFAGRVSYGDFTGDIILVRYRSDVRHW
jgi:hypothetical protein